MSFDSSSPALTPIRKLRRFGEPIIGKTQAGILTDPANLTVDKSSPTTAPASPPPTPQAADVDVARKNVRERMLRARGRGASQSAGLLRTKPSLNRPVLSDTLG